MAALIAWVGGGVGKGSTQYICWAEEMVQGHQDLVVGRIMAQVSLFLRALYGNIPHSAKKSCMFTLWGTVLFTHWIIDGSVAKVNTHLGRYPKESCDEIITLQYPLLLELQRGRGG